MNLSEICIKRPIFATVLSLMLILIGIVGFHYLNTRFFPKFQRNSILITTTYAGASAKLIETTITTPLEKTISGLEGVDTMTSESQQGMSSITVKVAAGYSLYQLANKIRNRVALVSDTLPSNAKTPTVRSGHGSSDLMDIAFTSSRRNLKSLRDYVNRFVINKIQQTPGVANVKIDGSNKYAMRIWLNPQKMATRHISVTDVQNAIENANVQLPAGSIKDKTINLPITAETKLTQAQQFRKIVVKKVNNNTVHLNDIAKVNLGIDNANKSIIRINNKLGVLITLYSNTDANPMKVANRVTQLLSKMKSQLPTDIQYTTTYNQANFMRNSVEEVYIAIGIAILCVILIIYLFLGRLRTTFIPLVTIPICLIAVFGLIYFLGFTLNVITLLAIALSIGLIVDDAIVMLENIYRHIESGMEPIAAAIKGSKEITFTVIAMTLTLAAVYAPIGLIQGHASNIFKSFAYTLAGAVIISGFIALTLSPMMSSRILKINTNNTSSYSHFVHVFFEKLAAGYRNLLGHVLKMKLLIVIVAFLIAIGGFYLYKNIPTAFMPKEDIGFVIGIINRPAGSSLAQTESQVQKLTKIMQTNSNIKTIGAIASDSVSGSNMIFATLIPYAKRTLSADQIAQAISQKAHQIPGLNVNVFAPYFGGSMRHQLAFAIMGSGNYLDLYHTSQTLLTALAQYPGMKNVKSDMNFDSQQYKLTVNRELADNLGITVKDIDSTLATLLGGSTIGNFPMNGLNYDVIVQAEKKFRTNLNSIYQFNIEKNDKLIPLSNLVKMTPILTQPTLLHYDRLRSATISAELTPGYDLGTVVAYLEAHLPQLLPSNVKYAFEGRAKNVVDSSSNMGLIFGLAVVFIFLVLSAQFESFIDPLIILLAVPLSIVGALFSLKLANGSLNIYTDIGLVTLIGLISKHGILITHFANKLREDGMEYTQALIKAAGIRLRPILMTTLAMIFGTLPLIFTTGASAASRREIGIVIIGGLFFGTFFSLILVPVTYAYAAKLKMRFAKNKKT